MKINHTFGLWENKPNSKPIYAQTNPISIPICAKQSQFKPNFYTIMQNKANFNTKYAKQSQFKPNLVRHLVRRSFSEDGSLGEGGFKGKKICPAPP